MSGTIKFPNNRKIEVATTNPLFVEDIQNSTSDLLEAMQSICGLTASDFAIISGLEYSVGTYTAGIVWIYGQFYRVDAAISENSYLQPTTVSVYNKLFGDAVSRPTYDTYAAVESLVTGSGFSPQFVGDMNTYRINLTFLKSKFSGFTANKNIISNSLGVIEADNISDFSYKKVVAMGSWNMDSTATKTFSTGLINKQIISISFIINSNGLVSVTGITSETGIADFTNQLKYDFKQSSGNLAINRANAGYYDSAPFNDTTTNRGYIVIEYL
jgi:hypothetical protein